MAKDTIVLESKELGVREFTLEHAQSLIRYEHKIGKSHWVPVKGSHYTIQDGSLTKTKNTGAVSSPKAQRSDSECEETGD